MKNDNAISVENVSKSYKMYSSPMDRIKEFLHPGKTKYHSNFWALRDISFDIARGTTFGIIGQNGSGKSTLLQIISGIIRPTYGSVVVNGRVSALLELGAGFHREFTGRENVFMQGALMGISREEMEKNYENIQDFADIGNFIDQPVKTYSSGMYVRLAFATAVNIDPDILIIDEGLAVGDDMFRRRCFRRLEDFQEQGKTILFVSHSLPTVTSICINALLLDKGEIVEIGNPKDIANIYSKLISDREEIYLKKLSDINRNKISAQELSDERLEEPEAVSESEFRYGAGGAELIDIELLNHKKEKVNILEHGKNFTIRIQVLFKKQMKDPMIGFLIRTLTGIDISGTNTILSNTPIGEVEQGSKITIEFNQKMRINEGSYTLTSGIAEDISKLLIFHDRRMDVIVFKVIGNGPSGGLIDMDTSVHFTMDPTKQID